MVGLPPLVAPPFLHSDACGVGFVADRHRRVTHRMTRLAVECLRNLDHRGAKAVDGTGDGAGILTRLPYRLLAREVARLGRTPPPEGRLGVLMTFLPADAAEECRRCVEEALVAEGCVFLGWRPVPVGSQALGGRARATQPLIEQALVDAGAHSHPDEFERRLLLARKAAHRALTQSGIEGYTVASASARTVVYKGLFTAARIDDFYWDLNDPAYETDFAVFHQRYSTNTFPSWALAQPFRMLAHNGEINTIRSNRAWMAAREVDFSSQIWGERAADLRPLMWRDKSDSASLDNALELLVRSGRDLDHAKEMLIPAAWENVPDLPDEVRAFYEYHAFLTEPWDGPAAIAASDGRKVMAAMDLNGLRPARWAITPDLVLVASEAGIAPGEEVNALATGQLGPGESLVFDLETGELTRGAEVVRRLAARRPYREWIRTRTLYVHDPFDTLQDHRFDAAALARVFGYTAEERRLLLAEMARGRQAVGSMGNDTPLAALSPNPQRLSRYFHQMFAQVTNPPMDPIRERLVMSLQTYLGRRGSLLEETEEQAALMELASPILADAEVTRITSGSDPAFPPVWFDTVFPAAGGTAALRPALEDLCEKAEGAVRRGATILVLSDRATSDTDAPIPMLLAVGAVHHRLIRTGLRLRASIVAVSGDPRDEHDIACLIAHGASAVNPYLAIEQVRAMAAAGDIPLDPVSAQEGYREALEQGLLKILSKMGICTLSAYLGSELFEAVGLDEELCDLAFRFTARRVGGRGFHHIASGVLELHSRYRDGEEGPGGYYKHRRGGEPHVMSPSAVLGLQKAVRSGSHEAWEAYLEEIHGKRPPAQLRDLFRFVEADPIPVEEVEPVESIMPRFTGAAMSLGALSREAHQALAEAMHRIGGLSNSGEGGEDPVRFGTPRNSGIKQVASGRFGVTPGYLASAQELQIKMAQGSKPGEGGQLPGHKVSDEIGRLRHTEPGVTLISPPPHHDIYSIEDLAQLIHDLKAFKPTARVSVKLVSEPGVGVVAVGVAKAHADAILVSGNEGGTGASPLTSVKHAGSPWEIGVAEAHQTLAHSGLRERVILEADGGLRSGRDVVVAALLGAERFGFGTLPLLALGCKMVRRCHENTCPVGIATQREDLRAKFAGAPDQVVALFRLLAEEIRRHLAALGARSLAEIIGRTDLLRPINLDDPVAESVSALLTPIETRRETRQYHRVKASPLNEALVSGARQPITDGTPVKLAFPVSNTDRSVGTRLAGMVAEQHPGGLPPDTVAITLAGTAGQSLGAFLADGISIRLDGTANDYVGKGMGGGRIVIVPTLPSLDSGAVAHGAGNACLYGATGGHLLVAGTVGQRFAVRNSGALAVAEGCGEHGCEYMTGGVVVVLGRVGRNFAAGMTGGVAYVYDPDGVMEGHFAETAPPAVRPAGDDLGELRTLMEAHRAATSSRAAAAVLESWAEASGNWWVLRASSRETTGRALARAFPAGR